MTLRERVLGPRLNPLDPRTRHHIALAAFLAWIGLGADGLSSSCYGPAEAWLQLGDHTELGLFLAIATAATVFVISLAYNQVIELFPSGGGGYRAATKLIGPYAGLVSGSALIVDYVLTIAISIASGMDALFSLFPPGWQVAKLDAALALGVVLLVLNLRGLKESIVVLMPVFLGFFLSHAALIVYGLGAHREAIGTLWPRSLAESRELADDSGWFFVVALFLRAFSVGGGTYTGIEAVSNSMQTLAEPRVRTGHWTMSYMALSLAFTAGGIVLLYLLWNAVPADGQTLNAVVFRSIIGSLGWSPDVSEAALAVTLALEAGLLLVAANTGFIGGPAVLASMASDRWVPRQFRQLSSRLVTRNGLVVLGVAAIVVLMATRGDVALLVVLYSINVFITFTLTLLGLCRHWLDQRRYRQPWRRPFALSLLGLAVTGFILVVLVIEKFTDGGWVTLMITGAVAGLCLLVRRHYDGVARLMVDVDRRFEVRKTWDDPAVVPVPDPAQPTAIVLVGSSRGAAMHVVQWIEHSFGDRFRNYLFVAVGEVDRDAFATDRSMASLQARIDNALHYFTSYAINKGRAARSYSAYGSDPFFELKNVLGRLAREYPDSIAFASKLVFQRDTFITRLLHNQLPLAIQRHLHQRGQQLVIVPLRVAQGEA